MATVTRETTTQTVVNVTSVTLVLSAAEAQRVKQAVHTMNTLGDDGVRLDEQLATALAV